MGIEAKAGLFHTIVHERSISPIFTGRRSWVTVTDKHLLSVASNNGDTRVEAVDPTAEEDSILYERTRLHRLSGTQTMEERIRATGDEINDPKQPWHNRVRRVTP